MIVEDRLENRRSCRYDAVRSAVYLGWWEEPDFRCCAAELRNLSQGGALIDVPIPPPQDAVLYLCMGESATAHWTEAAVVSVTNPRDRVYRIRLAFSETCPYEMFNLAVFGISGEI
ncbi:MAG: PilZ domain-containing protein [Isosphaeraceae bacterium]